MTLKSLNNRGIGMKIDLIAEAACTDRLGQKSSFGRDGGHHPTKDEATGAAGEPAGQRCLNWAGRLSANAAMPSF